MLLLLWLFQMELPSFLSSRYFSILAVSMPQVKVESWCLFLCDFLVGSVFLGGMSGDEGQKAAGIVVVLLLWRIARVVDGLSHY